MQCGPIRYRVDQNPSIERGFLHKVKIRETAFTQPAELEGAPLSMPAIYSALGHDEARNAAIFDDVLTTLEAGRCPLILTERRDHVESLRQRFENSPGILSFYTVD